MAPEDIRNEEALAAWHSSLALRDAVSDKGFNLDHLSRAMYYAGRAYALYQARDAVDTLQGKLKAKAERASAEK
jgi:hypothetical protein